MESKELLEEKIVLALESLDPDDEDYKDKVESVAKLYKLKTEEARVENDALDRGERLKFDKGEANQNEFNRQDAVTREEKDRWWKRGLEATSIIGPLVFYGIWMSKGFKFEETGTIASSTFRGLTRFFKPTRK